MMKYLFFFGGGGSEIKLSLTMFHIIKMNPGKIVMGKKITGKKETGQC